MKYFSFKSLTNHNLVIPIVISLMSCNQQITSDKVSLAEYSYDSPKISSYKIEESLTRLISASKTRFPELFQGEKNNFGKQKIVSSEEFSEVLVFKNQTIYFNAQQIQAKLQDSGNYINNLSLDYILAVELCQHLLAYNCPLGLEISNQKGEIYNNLAYLNWLRTKKYLLAGVLLGSVNQQNTELLFFGLESLIKSTNHKDFPFYENSIKNRNLEYKKPIIGFLYLVRNSFLFGLYSSISHDRNFTEISLDFQKYLSSDKPSSLLDSSDHIINFIKSKNSYKNSPSFDEFSHLKLKCDITFPKEKTPSWKNDPAKNISLILDQEEFWDAYKKGIELLSKLSNRHTNLNHSKRLVKKVKSEESNYVKKNYTFKTGDYYKLASDFYKEEISKTYLSEWNTKKKGFYSISQKPNKRMNTKTFLYRVDINKNRIFCDLNSLRLNQVKIPNSSMFWEVYQRTLELSSKKKKLKKPTEITIQGISDNTSFSIIRAIVKEKATSPFLYPFDYKGEIFDYEFPVDSYQAKALLGSPALTNLVWFVYDYATELDHPVIKKVRLKREYNLELERVVLSASILLD